MKIIAKTRIPDGEGTGPMVKMSKAGNPATEMRQIVPGSSGIKKKTSIKTEPRCFSNATPQTI